MSAGLNSALASIQPMPVTVPSTFLSMIVTRWPQFNTSYWLGGWNDPQYSPLGGNIAPNPSSVNVAAYDSWDCGYGLWAQVELSAGVYTWASLDLYVTTMRNRGLQFNYTVWATPTFYASAGDQTHNANGLYGAAGYPASTAPNGLTALSNFITALVTRYNTSTGGWATQANGSGTNWSVLGKGIQSITTWGEFDGAIGYSSNYYWGTTGQLVDMMYTIRTAAKAVDSAILITTPELPISQAGTTLLTTAGTINTGVTGVQTVDVIYVENYNVNLPGQVFADWTIDEIGSDANSITSGYTAFHNMIKTAGATALPVWTVLGMDYRPIPLQSAPALTLMLAQSPNYRYTFWLRMLAFYAAQGYQRVVNYCWDGPFSCYPCNDPNGVPLAINQFATHVVGKTITSATYTSGGPITLTFSTGETFTA